MNPEFPKESNWREEDTVRALQIWAEYQRTHDVLQHHGKAVGIDPGSGLVWFGESAVDITEQMLAAGLFAPFFCLRVGSDYYLDKGARA